MKHVFAAAIDELITFDSHGELMAYLDKLKNGHKDFQILETADTMVARLLEFYRDNTVGIYEHRSNREELQHYAEMIHGGTYKNNPNSNMLDLLKDQAYELFN